MQNLLVQFFATGVLSMISLLAHAQLQTDNHTPAIKIDKPKFSQTLKGNTLIPYAITVNDREDGNSAYDEIPNRAVILIVKYLKNAAALESYQTSMDQDLLSLIKMSKSTCLNCHAANSKLIGPSFDLIAQKYSSMGDARTYLSEKILTGGTGVWGEEKMPPQPDLTAEEVSLLVDWILKQKDNPTQFYVGLEGTIKTKEIQINANQEVCVLTAAYEDHGTTDAPNDKQVGKQTITLKIMH